MRRDALPAATVSRSLMMLTAQRLGSAVADDAHVSASRTSTLRCPQVAKLDFLVWLVSLVGTVCLGVGTGLTIAISLVSTSMRKSEICPAARQEEIVVIMQLLRSCCSPNDVCVRTLPGMLSQLTRLAGTAVRDLRVGGAPHSDAGPPAPDGCLQACCSHACLILCVFWSTAAPAQWRTN